MEKFEFKKNCVNLDINGNCFNVELTNKVIIACDRLKYEAGDFVEMLSKVKDAETAETALTNTCNTLAKGIEDILGCGGVKKIYGDEAISLFNLTDVIVYIRKEIMDAIKTKAKKYNEVNK